MSVRASARAGRELLTLGEPERAAYLIGEALALWRGRALVDLEGWGPGRTEAARLEELRLDAEELGIDAAMRAGRHREVLAEAESRVAEVPLREHRWALLALAQYQAGQQGDALRTLHRARGALHRAGPRSRSRPRRPRAGDPATRPVACSGDGGFRSQHDLPVPGSGPLRRRRRRPLLRTRRGRGGVRATARRRRRRHGDRAVGFGEVVAGAGRDRSNPASRARTGRRDHARCSPHGCTHLVVDVGSRARARRRPVRRSDDAVPRQRRTSPVLCCPRCARRARAAGGRDARRPHG